MFALKFFTVLNILFTFMIFEQLALALKNRVALKFFTVLKYFLSFSNFEQLALVLKTGVCTENFHWLKCFLLFRNLEQLALALKTEFALKFFKLGGSSSPRLIRLWNIEDENTIHCLENDNFKTAYIRPVSSEWIVLFWLKY